MFTNVFEMLVVLTTRGGMQGNIWPLRQREVDSHVFTTYFTMALRGCGFDG